MGFFNWLSNMFDTNSLSNSSQSTFKELDELVINPANGLPMVGGIGGVDVEGNSYGTSHDAMFSGLDSDFSANTDFDSGAGGGCDFGGFDNDFSSSSGFDTDFGGGCDFGGSSFGGFD